MLPRPARGLGVGVVIGDELLAHGLLGRADEGGHGGHVGVGLRGGGRVPRHGGHPTPGMRQRGQGRRPMGRRPSSSGAEGPDDRRGPVPRLLPAGPLVRPTRRRRRGRPDVDEAHRIASGDQQGGVLGLGGPPPGRALGEREADEQPLLVRRTRRGVVRDQVAHAVDDPLAVDVLHRLHDVGVVAEHEVDVGRSHQRGAEGALGGGRRRVVLVAPVQGDDHHLRPPGPGRGRVGADAGLVDRVRAPGLAVGRGDAVEAERVREQGHVGALDRQERGRRRLGGCAGRPGVGDARGVEGAQRPVDPRGAPVVGVVRRRRAGVEAGVGQGGHDLGRHRERRVAPRRLARAGHGRLQVADGDVGAAHERRHPGQQRAEVEPRRAGGRGVGRRLLPQRWVQQHVAPGHQRERARGRCRRPGWSGDARGGRGPGRVRAARRRAGRRRRPAARGPGRARGAEQHGGRRQCHGGA